MSNNINDLEYLSAAQWKKEADEIHKGLLEIESQAELGSPMYFELFETYAMRKGLI